MKSTPLAGPGVLVAASRLDTLATMRASDPRPRRLPSYPGVHLPSVVIAAACGLVLMAGTALAAGFPGPKPVELSGTAPLRLTETTYRADPMRRASKSWPVQPSPEGEEPTPPPEDHTVEGRLGKGPWRLFESTFAEESCRAPRLDDDGTTSMAICSGLDVSRPDDENVILVQDGELSRYRFPVASLPEPEQTVIALGPDGLRFAVLTEEGGGRTVHMVNLATGQDWAIAGGWRDPGNPVVASEADVVAFVAHMGRDLAAIVVDVRREEAIVVRRARSRLAVHGLSPDGRKVVLVGDTNDRAQLLLFDLDSSKMQVLSHRKSQVTSVAVHPSADGIAYGADVGGVCAMYWADVSGRRRVELMTSVESCFQIQGVDEARRSILYTESVGEERFIRIHDRRRDERRYQVIKGCVEPSLSYNGALMTVRCPKARMGAGGYLFVLPPPEDDE
jgi:hypothetical protein